MKNLSRQTISLFWQFTVKYRWHLVLSAVSSLIMNASGVYVPFLYKQLLDAIATNDLSLLPTIYRIIVVFVFVNIVFLLSTQFKMGANITFQTRTMADIANHCYNYLNQHSYSFFNDNFSGALTKKVSRYIKSYEELTDQATWRIAESLVRLLFIIIALALRNIWLSIFTIIWTIAYILFSLFIAKKRQLIDLKKSEADSIASAHLADTIVNYLNLKIFSSRQAEEKRYEKLTGKQFGYQKQAWDYDRKVESIITAFMIVLETGLLIMAVGLWQRGLLTVGDFALIQGLLIQLFDYLWNISGNMRNVYDSLASANEMTEILRTPFEVKDIVGAKDITVDSGNVQLSNITFGYHADKLFNAFDLTIRNKERLALIGSSGSGKTTLVKLILRFMDVQDGHIRIDNQDIATVTQDSLQSAIAYVPQEALLFHRSIMENIRYSKQNATDDEVKNAAKLAHAHEFINNLPNGYDTLVGERGVKLSGGERQRIAIARAILKNAPILILDEATSQLDSQSERYIQDALKTLIKDKTVIVIAHRLSTIKQMDRIIVLEKGKIVEEGTHEMLLKLHKGTYQKLWQIQAGGFS